MTELFQLSTAIRLLKFALITANFLIILDAIFLLISEKDSYQGEFIAGRHPVSRLLILMLWIDLQSILMIVIAVLGIIGVRHQNQLIVLGYGLIVAVVAAMSVNDTDAFIMELVIVALSLCYALAIRTRDLQQHQEQFKYKEMPNV